MITYSFVRSKAAETTDHEKLSLPLPFGEAMITDQDIDVNVKQMQEDRNRIYERSFIW